MVWKLTSFVFIPLMEIALKMKGDQRMSDEMTVAAARVKYGFLYNVLRLMV